MSTKDLKTSKGKKGSGKGGADAENIVRYTIYGISGVVAVCLLLAVVFLIIPNTVATVGAQKVTQDEYVFFYQQTLNSYLQYNTEQMDPDQFLNQDLGGITFRQMAITSATQQVHEYAIQYDLARKNNITLAQDEINNVSNNLMEYLKEVADEYGVSINTVSKANFGLPFNKVIKIYEKLMLGDKFANQQITESKLTEEDYINYYNENSETIDRVKARHILLLVDEENDSAVKIEGIEKKAAEILERVNAGEDFTELVKEFSEDEGSVEAGGEITFARGRMVPEFEEFSFNNEPGTTGIVKSDYGYHIMEVMEHLFGYDANADLVKSQLPSMRYNEKLKELKEGTYALEFRPSFNNIFR